MFRRMVTLMVIIAGFVIIFLLGSRLSPVQGQAVQAPGIPEDNGTKGFQEQYGQYSVVPNWPKPLPDFEGKWTWGAIQGIFAESSNKVFILQRGELPALKRPPNTPIPQFGPTLSFPVMLAPFRNASQGPVGSPPNENSEKGVLKEGVDYRWRNILVVVDRNGNLIEAWNQWDSLFKRPHAVFISPYDPEKHVWVVDDTRQAIFEFTNDGKKLVLTIGTPNEPGNDDKHYGRPTFLAWLPDGTMFLTDGYINTRVVKFDKDGKYLMAWGQKGINGNETRPSYFNTVHGLAIDPVERHVYVSDRGNRRVQVFDENGKFLDLWWVGHPPSQIYQLYMGTDRTLWGADAGTNKMVQWDRSGKYLYSWGFLDESGGGLWCPHGLSVDEQGNLYTADVCRGAAQKFQPKPGANQAKMLGLPVRSAWD